MDNISLYTMEKAYNLATVQRPIQPTYISQPLCHELPWGIRPSGRLAHVPESGATSNPPIL